MIGKNPTLAINVPQLRLNSQAAVVSAQLGLAIAPQQSPELALHAQIHHADAKQADLFYPHLSMGENLVSYLNRGIIAGDIEQGQVLFNGQLSAFPFKENQGIFVADAELTDAKFSFDQHWPAITNFSANLNFTNEGMQITAREGQLSGLNVRGVNADIDDLGKEKLLIVKANINQASSDNLTTLMQASPLKGSVGETLAQLQISGDVDGDFQLSLPLKGTDKTVASGRILLADNNIALQTPRMDLAKVNGEVRFVNDHVTSDNLTVNWRGMPLNITVDAYSEAQHFQTDIDLVAYWQQQHWQAQLPDQLKTYGSGDFAWQGALTLNFPNSGGFSYQAKLTSDLIGSQLALPKPYNKQPQQSVAVSAQVTGQNDSSTINVSAGEQLLFYGVLDHKKTQFSQAHLVLGNEQMLLPTDGFHITTNLPYADISAWDGLISDILSSIEGAADSGEQFSLLNKPERIRGTVKQADIWGQQFNEVSFNLLDQNHWWLLQLNAKEARGQVKFYPDIKQQGIDIDADFITLPESADTKETEETKLSPSELVQVFEQVPPMRVNCDQCQIGLLDLGKVQFDVQRGQDNILLLNGFRSTRGKNQLNLFGQWQLMADNQSITQLAGQLTISDIAREVEQFGYASVMKDSGAKADFDVNWSGGPQDFDIGQLNGDVKLEIDDGYLADVSDKGTRIFSILSLQSLVRKLTLDFRDIFSDGMFYSSIKGDAHIKDGILYTDNTKMKGTAGDLSIKGNTKLAEGLLDYRMSYKPNLTSSLPVLAWISTLNPAVFLAGVALDEVFTSKVVSEFNFELTGNLSEPNLKEVDRKTRDVSVGRSTPPQFVDANTKQESTNLPQPQHQNKGY